MLAGLMRRMRPRRPILSSPTLGFSCRTTPGEPLAILVFIRYALKHFRWDRRDVKRQRQPLCDSREGREALRAALLAVLSNPWIDAGWDPASPAKEVLLGVISSDIRLAMRALRDYTEALNLPLVTPESRVPGEPNVALIRVGLLMPPTWAAAAAERPPRFQKRETPGCFRTCRGGCT